MKRFLLFLLTLCTVVYVNAFKVDDYLFTHTAKFKVTGDNLVTNGDFSSASNGWTNSGGAEVSALSWQYTPGAGPNGEAVLMSLSGDAGNVLARAFGLPAGTYSVSYWIKGGEAGGTTANSSAYANYAGVFVNNDASFTTVVRQVNDQTTFTTEWSQVIDTVNIASGEYLVMYFDKMAANTMVTGFEIHEIKEVYDTRKLEYEVAFAKDLLANKAYFTNGVEDFQVVVKVLESAIAAPNDFINTDDIKSTKDFLANEWEPQLQSFLTSNSANAISEFTHWYDGTKGQKLSSKGSWVLPSGRWFHCNNVYTEEEMQRIYNQIQGSYDLPEADAYVHTTLEPGIYMLSMDIKGFYYAGTTADVRYTPDYNSQVKGLSLYANDNAVSIDVLPTTAYKRYTVFFKIDESTVNNAKFGVEHVFDPDMVGKKLGGEISLSNVYFRKIGISQEEYDLEQLVDNIAAQQNVLKLVLDSAKAITANPAKYPWGLETLTTAVTANEEFLNETYQFVDVDGKNVGLTTKFTDYQKNLPNTISDKTSALRTAIQNLYGINKPHTDMVDAILYHKAVLADALYASAAAESRANYASSITDAENLYSTLGVLDSISSIEEAVKYKDAMDLMLSKELTFKGSCASYALPTLMAVKNADMRNGGTGKPAKNAELVDWNSVFDTANGWRSGEKWNYSDLSKYGIDGCAVQYWRGYTASPQGQTSQQITLTDAGVYEFEAYTYGNNENAKGRGYYTLVTDEASGLTVDTLFNKSGLKIFFGISGNEDSIRIHSQYSEDGYKPSKKIVTYIKTAAGEETLTFGFHATPENIGGSGCNYFGFGPVRLLYGGATSAYFEDLEADVTATVAKAKEMIELHKNNTASKWLAVKLERYINDAVESRLPWMSESVDKTNIAKVITAKRNALINMNLTMERMKAFVIDDNAVQNLTLNKVDANVIEGDTVVLIATVLPSTAVAEVVWSTSDASVATVDNGVVTALKAGTATITATAGDKSASCEIVVESKPVSNAYSFVVNDVVLRAGESMLYPVALDNQDSVSAFQCDVYLPEGITLQTKKNKYDITLDENRVDDHTVTSSVQPDGAIRMVVASLTSSDFIGNSGNLFYLNLLASEGISGEYPISIKNIHVSESNGTRHDLADVSAIINVPAYTPGDVNNDGLLMVDDIVMTINYILGDVSENFVFVAADMNSDNQIMIDDVVSVINAILGVSSSKQHFADNAFGSETLTLRNCGFKNGKSEFGLSLSNASNYSALQFDLRLPSGVTLDDIVVTSSSNHVVSFREVGAGVVRAVVASLDNEPFSGADQLLVRVNAPMPSVITVINGFASTATSKLVGISESSVQLNGGTTGIESLGVSSTPSNIYDLSGRLVKHNATSTDGLRKGVYMMNGKKLIIE